MRVIAGSLGGRQFAAPAGHKTHPMSEKARGALFNVLGDVSGLTIFDGFSGSGAISIEAVSRGASKVIAVESDRDAFKTIQRNLDELDIADKVQLQLTSVNSWSNNHHDTQFDVLVVDPPYARNVDKTLAKLPRHLTEDGTLVISQPTNVPVLKLAGLEVVKQSQQGDATLVFYQRA